MTFIKSNLLDQFVVVAAFGEYIAKNGYTLNDTAADVLKKPVLFYSTVDDDVKVTMADGTVGVFNSLELTAVNAHVIKVWDTGTNLTTSQFRLYM